MTTIKKRFKDLEQALSHDGHLMHVSRILQRAAHRWPERIALQSEDKNITYHQLLLSATHMSHYLLRLNVKQNDRIVIVWENSIEFYKAYWAAWQAGAIVVPLNVYLHERELEHIINDCKPAIIIASEKQAKKLEGLKHLSTDLPIILGEEDFLRIDSQSQVGRSEPMPRFNHNNNDCAAILYTSGTTGNPKGVILSSRNILINSMQGIANFDVTANERILAALPLFHSYMQNAAVWSPFIVGATVIIVPSITRAALLQGLKQNPSIVLGIPQLFGLFCLMKTAPLKNIKLFVSGGDALHNKICMGFELLYQRKIANGYGLTETAPFIAVDLDDSRKPVGCVGRPMEGIAVEIRDEKGAVLPVCSKGVLWVRGENIMMGYYNAPEPTGAILVNGWLNTGDFAYIDHDGYIVLCGRERDLLSHKGFKIYPQEIENILTRHQNVTMAAVVGMVIGNDEVPVAFVASASDFPELAQELKELCLNNLARYKVPMRFYVQKELPTTATGKIDKKVLRQKLEQMQQEKPEAVPEE